MPKKTLFISFGILVLIIVGAFAYLSYKPSDCYTASVKEMKAKNYPPAAVNGTCSSGFKLNSLLCVDSARWCEPVVSDVQPQQNESVQKSTQTVKTYKGSLIGFQYPSSWVFEQMGQIINLHLPSDEIWTEPGSTVPLALVVKIVDISLYIPKKYIDAEKTYDGHVVYQTPKIKKLSCANMTKTVEIYKDETIEMGYDIITKMPIEKYGIIFEFSFSYGVNGYCMEDTVCRVNEEKIITQNEETECKILSSVMFPN